MNENRGVFTLDGVTGFLIATALLLSILGGLTYWGIGVQQGNATKYYKIKNEQSIKMFSKDNYKHVVNVK